jgi:hypothetical protein
MVDHGAGHGTSAALQRGSCGDATPGTFLEEEDEDEEDEEEGGRVN